MALFHRPDGSWTRHKFTLFLPLIALALSVACSGPSESRGTAGSGTNQGAQDPEGQEAPGGGTEGGAQGGTSAGSAGQVGANPGMGGSAPGEPAGMAGAGGAGEPTGMSGAAGMGGAAGGPGEMCVDPGGMASEYCDDNDVGGPCEDSIQISECSAYFFRSYDLDEYNPNIVRAVIAVHGVGRTYGSQFSSVLRVVRDADREDEVLVIAPLYAEEPRPGEWNFDRYQGGSDGECNGADTDISSFFFTDTLIEKLASCDNFPNLTDVVVIGHSGGGQHVGRYAAVTRVVPDFPRLTFKFVPNNPSTWVFLNDQRWTEGGWTNDTDAIVADINARIGNGGIPETCDRLGSYNRWNRGLDNIERHTYISELGLTEDDVRNNWRTRNIVYAIGLEDNTDAGSMDSSCTARAQGEYRLQRGQNMYRNVMEFFPPIEPAVHELSEIPDCAHSSGCMYRSDAGRRHILE